ncbi:EamA family transporter [Chloroflexota bacterium]
MNWTGAATLSAAILSLVNVIDSHLVSKRFPSLQAFLVPVSIIHLTTGLIAFLLFPLPKGVGIIPLLVALSSGILRTAAVSIMLYMFKKEDVSRVVPIVYTYPIFVAIMAVPLLGESLNYLQWLAILIVVAGAMVVSAENSLTGAAARLGKPFLFLFVSSLLTAVADIAGKYSLSYISFWNLFSLVSFSLSGIFMVFSIRPHVLKELKNLEQKKVIAGFLAFNEMMAPVALVLSYWAMQRGPVSLVSAIIGSRPVFVAIYSLLLGMVFPGFLIRSTIRKIVILRLLATAMIFSGISIIYLT